MSLVTKFEKLIDYVQDTRQTFLDRGVNISETAGIREFEGAATQLHSKTLQIVDRSITSLTAKDLKDLTSIGPGAFSGCTNLTSVVIPSNVLDISAGAFLDCPALASVEFENTTGWQIPDGENFADMDVSDPAMNAINLKAASQITTWHRVSKGLNFVSNGDGTCAVSGIGTCTDTCLIIPPKSPGHEVVTSIKSGAFSYSNSIREVILPNSLTTIGSSAFNYCNSLTKIRFSDNLQKIESYAFASCPNLTKIVLPDSLTAIGSNAFQYDYKLESVTLGTNLTSIGNSAFYSCRKLIEVINKSSLSLSVGSISYGYIAYYAIDVLSSAETTGFTQLRDYVFFTSTKGINYLTDYTGDEVNLILPESFNGASYIISKYAFASNSKIESIIISDQVTQINTYAFTFCTNLCHISLGRNLTSIESEAFSSCYKLVDIVNHSNLQITKSGNTHGRIGQNAIDIHTGQFRPCSIQNGYICYTAIDDTKYLLGSTMSADFETELTLPESIDGSRYKIHNYAFYGMNLVSIIIGPGVQTIGKNAFASCGDSVGSITIPSSVELVEAYAFQGNYCLERILASAATTIQDYAFYGCESVTIYCYDADEHPETWGANCALVYEDYWEDEYGEVYEDYWHASIYFDYDISEDGNFLLYNGNIVSYIGHSPILVIPDGVTSIASSTFEYCSNLTSVTIPDSVTSIGSYAFYGCTNLTSVTMGNSVTSIDMSAFGDCYSLVNINIPDSLNFLGTSAFLNCENLQYNHYENANYLGNNTNPYVILMQDFTDGTCSIHQNTKCIYTHAFLGHLTEINFPDSITYVCTSAFAPQQTNTDFVRVNIGSLAAWYRITFANTDANPLTYAGHLILEGQEVEELTIPTTITKINNYAFCGLQGLQNLVIPNHVKSIGKYAFYSCTNLQSVSLPSYLTSIEDYTFAFCENLETITLPTNCMTIGQYTFSNCKKLKNLVLPNRLTTIGTRAFDSCIALSDITFGQANCSIGTYAFNACSGLTEISIPANITNINKSAFYNCSKLTKLEVPYIGPYKNASSSYSFLGYIFGAGSYSSQASSIPASLTTLSITGTGSIPKNACYGCTSLVSVVIGNGITSLGDAVFSGCTKLANVTLGTGLTNIPQKAFYGCTALQTIDIPSNIKTITRYAFQNCTNLTSADFANKTDWLVATSTTSSNQIEVDISDTADAAKYLRSNYYNYYWSWCGDCSHASLTILAAVAPTCSQTGLTEGQKCTLCGKAVVKQEVIPATGVHNIEILEAKAPTCSETGLTEGQKCADCDTIIVAQETIPCTAHEFVDKVCTHCGEAYSSSGLTFKIYSNGYSGVSGIGTCKDDVVVVPKTAPTGEPVKYIEASAFANNTTITKIMLPDCVTEVKSSAFSGCTNLTKASFPGVQYLRNKAFYNCMSLAEVSLPQIVNIEYNVFYKCEAIVNCTIGSTIRAIDDSCFSGSKMTNLYISGLKNWCGVDFGFNTGPTYYAENVYVDGELLVNLVIPEEVHEVKAKAFSGVTSLESVTIPTSVTKIGDAFGGCSNLKAVYISDLAAWCSTPLSSWTSLPSDSMGAYTGLQDNGTKRGVSGTPLINGADLYLNGQLVTDLVIPEGVTSIECGSFAGCTSITSVTLPDSLTSIGFSAFENCPNLTTLTIANCTATDLAEHIAEATSLTKVQVADSNPVYSSIENNLYSKDGKILYSALSARGQTSFTIPETVESLGDYALTGNTSLNTVVVSDGVKTIGETTFRNCIHLVSVTLGTNVTEIGSKAFHRCFTLVEVINNSKLNLTDSEAVGYVSSYALVIHTGPSKIVHNDSYLFYTHQDINYLVSYSSQTAICNLPESYNGQMYRIKTGAFYQATITDLVLSTGIAYVENSAFDSCSQLVHITFPTSVSNLDFAPESFYQCSAIQYNIVGASSYLGDAANPYLCLMKNDGENCVIKSTTEYINAKAMADYKIKTIELEANNTTYKFINDTLYTIDEKTLVRHVPSSTITAINIPTTVEIIRPAAFYYCKNLTAINNIPETVNVIGDKTFYNCSNLTSITLPNNITSIGASAFNSCSKLTSINIPESVTYIGKSAFSSCSTLTSVHITNLANWCAMSFEDSSANPLYCAKNLYHNNDLVTEVVFPDSVEVVSPYVFYNCTSITNVVIPANITSIGKYAFRDCTGLTDITIGDSVTSIGEYAFAYCTSLTSINIPDSVISIGDRVFYGCSSLMNATIGDRVTSIGSYAFNSCKSLTSITIPDSVTYIGSYAFNSCTGLTSVYITNIAAWCNMPFANYYTNPLYYAKNLYLNGELVTDLVIPDSITSIGNYTFCNCTNLTSVTIPNSVTSIGDYAFNSSGLTSLIIPNSITDIGTYAFKCPNLTNITIGTGITSLKQGVFSGCKSLTSITIPDNVTSIGYATFSDCTGLIQVNLGSGIKSIDEKAFNNVGNATTAPQVTFDFSKATQIPSLKSGSTSSYYAIFYVPTGVTLIIKVPANLYSRWRTTTNWSVYSSKIISA